MKPLLGLILTLLVASLCECIPAGAGKQPLEPGISKTVRDCPEMVVVPAGSFIMGSPPTEKGRYSTEGPQHNVAIAKSFAVSKYEIRFVDWDACVTGGGCSSYKPNDFGWGRGLQPVVNVSWEDARQYVTWLSGVIPSS
jgi:formylglycine-generating enzyme required for sulfatase activity